MFSHFGVYLNSLVNSLYLMFPFVQLVVVEASALQLVSKLTSSSLLLSHQLFPLNLSFSHLVLNFLFDHRVVFIYVVHFFILYLSNL